MHSLVRAQRGTEFGVVPLVDGRTYWYAAANADEAQRNPEELEELRRRFGTWHEPIPAVLAHTPPEAVLRHDIYRLPKLDRYYRGSTCTAWAERSVLHYPAPVAVGPGPPRPVPFRVRHPRVDHPGTASVRRQRRSKLLRRGRQKAVIKITNCGNRPI